MIGNILLFTKVKAKNRVLRRLYYTSRSSKPILNENFIQQVFKKLTPEKEIYQLVSDRTAVRTDFIGEKLGFGHHGFGHSDKGFASL